MPQACPTVPWASDPVAASKGRLQDRDDILRNPLFQFFCFDVQRLQFFIQLFKANGKLEIVWRSFRHTHVAARIQAPALRFNFGKRGGFTQSKNIGVLALWKVRSEEHTSELQS